MDPRVATTPGASQREELASIRATPAKAELRMQTRTSSLREVAAEAIRSHSGNARAAAIDMAIHEGHLSRQLKDGSLRIEQLEALGPAFCAKLGQQLIDEFGPLADPKERARRLIVQMETILFELKQYVEHAA